MLLFTLLFLLHVYYYLLLFTGYVSSDNNAHFIFLQKLQKAHNNRKIFVSRLKMFVNDDEYQTTEVILD